MRDRILALCEAAGVRGRRLEHAPTRTSEASAEARGEPLEIGGKSLLLKLEDGFGIVVLSAARGLQTRGLRRSLGIKRTRFATVEELEALTGLVPGCVPPFGAPLWPLPLYADASIRAQPRIAFNPGRLDESLILATEDWLRIARPIPVEASRERKS